MVKADMEVPLIVHVIYRLGTGGLENGLVNIINRTPVDRYRHAIVCLTEAEEFARRITRSDTRVLELHAGTGHDFRLYFKLWRTLRRLRPAIVHTRNLATIEAQIPARVLRGVKTVHGEHGRDVFDLAGKNRKYNMLRRLIRPFVGRYVAVSKDLSGWLSNTLGVEPSRIRQIYNGVDQDVFAPENSGVKSFLPAGFLPENPIVMGTVGRLAAVKDQASLIKGFHLLLNRTVAMKNRLRLVIVGDGPLAGELDDLLHELEIADYVWMAGDRDDVAVMLRQLDIFVLPSLGEGISNTILEAMATGLPVIATDVGGNPELVKEGENGYLVPCNNPHGLAEAIEKLIGSENGIEAMGKASLRRVRETFYWDRTVSAYLDLYDELLKT